MDKEKQAYSPRNSNSSKLDCDFPIYSRVNKKSKRLAPQSSVTETIKDRIKTPTDPNLTYIQPFFPQLAKNGPKDSQESVSKENQPGLLHSASQPSINPDCLGAEGVSASQSQPQFPDSRNENGDESPPPVPPVRHSSIICSQIYQKVANNWKFEYLKHPIEHPDCTLVENTTVGQSNPCGVTEDNSNAGNIPELTEDNLYEDCEDLIPVPPQRSSSKPTYIPLPSLKRRAQTICQFPSSEIESNQSTSPTLSENTDINSDIGVSAHVEKEEAINEVSSNPHPLEVKDLVCPNPLELNKEALPSELKKREEISSDYNLSITHHADIYDTSVRPKISYNELLNSIYNVSQTDTDQESSIASDSADEQASLDSFADSFHSIDGCIETLGYDSQPKVDFSVRPKVKPVSKVKSRKITTKCKKPDYLNFESDLIDKVLLESDFTKSDAFDVNCLEKGLSKISVDACTPSPTTEEVTIPASTGPSCNSFPISPVVNTKVIKTHPTTTDYSLKFASLRKKILCKVCKSLLPGISGSCKQCCPLPKDSEEPYSGASFHHKQVGACYFSIELLL